MSKVKMQLNWEKITGRMDNGVGKLVTTYVGFEVGGPRALQLTVNGTNAETLKEACAMASATDTIPVIELGEGYEISKEPRMIGKGADAVIDKYRERSIHTAEPMVDGAPIEVVDAAIRPTAAVIDKDKALSKLSAFIQKIRPLPVVTPEKPATEKPEKQATK